MADLGRLHEQRMKEATKLFCEQITCKVCGKTEQGLIGAKTCSQMVCFNTEFEATAKRLKELYG